MLKKLFSLQGRVDRKFYWIFFATFLVYGIVVLLLAEGADVAYRSIAQVRPGWYSRTGNWITISVITLFGGLGVVACLSVMTRRMQDHGYSLRWLFIGAILFVLTFIALNLFDPQMRNAFGNWDYWYVLTRNITFAAFYTASLMLGGILLMAFTSAQYIAFLPPGFGVKVLILLPLTACGLWFLYVAGFQRGTVGPNRYGPDPVGKSRS